MEFARHTDARTLPSQPPAGSRRLWRSRADRPSSRRRLAAAAAWLACAVAAEAADERGLAAVWQRHASDPTAHAQVIAACDTFRAKAGGDPLVVVTETLAGWHLLKQGKQSEARERFMPLCNKRETPLQTAASNMARAWLTRLDLLSLHGALKDYYRKHVSYPESLDALKTLPDGENLPWLDRWGRPWDYRLTGFRMLKDMHDQRYAFQWRFRNSPLNLDEALAMPYGDGIGLVPERVATSGSSPVVRFVRGDNGAPLFLGIGAQSGDVVFAWMGRDVVILATIDHWALLPAPKR